MLGSELLGGGATRVIASTPESLGSIPSTIDKIKKIRKVISYLITHTPLRRMVLLFFVPC